MFCIKLKSIKRIQKMSARVEHLPHIFTYSKITFQHGTHTSANRILLPSFASSPKYQTVIRCPKTTFHNDSYILRSPSQRGRIERGKTNDQKKIIIISPVKPRGHLQVYSGGDDGGLVDMHVAPFKQRFGVIRQASPTY